MAFILNYHAFTVDRPHFRQKIDDPMAAKAMESANRIGLFCTSRTTVQPSEALLRYHADQKGRKVEIMTSVD